MKSSFTFSWSGGDAIRTLSRESYLFSRPGRARHDFYSHADFDMAKRSTLGRILHHRSRNACARAATRALKLCLTCLLCTFTWNYIAERVPFKRAYVARVALAKSKQRFAGHVNVAPFRAAQIRDLAFATSGKNLKLLHRKI